ncbi:ribonuclease HIII [Spiroplasma sp. TIUS-1]|uniref:ribonuclease HIII n=1 Tax=Spiroplasma sp. TIUS-1 TaxID=216963 RepID=UPI0013980326|nr:ribonuclease HIII [Spiroplasma sp. TIUS-1]QHX35989.1 ribonuclease HIII [Spiroplasma sp. TIUS-1]
MKNSYTFKKVESGIRNAILRQYQAFLTDSPNDNIHFFLKLDKGITISIFKNETILFQGPECHKIAGQFFGKIELSEDIKKEVRVETKLFDKDVIGADEVGVGDFFGPLVTCCAYISPQFVEQYPDVYAQLDDSKKMTDEKIVSLYFQIKDRIKYVVYIMHNGEYNDLYNKYKNTHVLKALAHNNGFLYALASNDFPKNKQIVLDQFVNKEKYFEYLKDEKEVVKADLKFQTKAESEFPSVAAASIIARYTFLTEVSLLARKYQIDLPLGASNEVKALVRKYKNEFKEETKNFIKLHFNDN